jgi:hypothetical protein
MSSHIDLDNPTDEQRFIVELYERTCKQLKSALAEIEGWKRRWSEVTPTGPDLDLTLYAGRVTTERDRLLAERDELRAEIEQLKKRAGLLSGIWGWRFAIRRKLAYLLRDYPDDKETAKIIATVDDAIATDASDHAAELQRLATP